VVGGLEAEAGAKGVRLAVAAPAETAVTGDRDRLGQVVGNLVRNAITYTPSGGRVAVEVAGDDRISTVAVSDTGIGLAPDDLERVFERFYRVEGVQRPPGGSGIGLGIARAIARAHGGDVTAASAGRGHGTTFTLRLPTLRAAGATTSTTG
jgi:histidine kinase